eukprot:458663_1
MTFLFATLCALALCHSIQAEDRGFAAVDLSDDDRDLALVTTTGEAVARCAVGSIITTACACADGATTNDCPVGGICSPTHVCTEVPTDSTLGRIVSECRDCNAQCVANTYCYCETCTTVIKAKRQTIQDNTQAIMASDSTTGFCTSGGCWETLCCLMLTVQTQAMQCSCVENGVDYNAPCPDIRTCGGSSSSNKSLLGLLGLLGLLALLLCCFLPFLCCPKRKSKPNMYYPSYLPEQQPITTVVPSAAPLEMYPAPTC